MPLWMYVTGTFISGTAVAAAEEISDALSRRRGNKGDKGGSK
jgi:hypothetical protein